MSDKVNSIQLHRVLKAPINRVYRAFTTAEALPQWMPPNGFTAKVQSMEFKVGGTYKMSFTNFTTQKSESFGGKYLKIIPNEFIQYIDQFDNASLPGEMQITISFKEVLCGTELHIKQENIPSMIPTEMCYLGWQESLLKLANLVEPEINQ